MKTRLRDAYSILGSELREHKVCYVNLWNDPNFYGLSKKEVVPRLLQKSHLFEMCTETELLAWQHFLVMG